MTYEEAKREIMQIYGSLSSQKQIALDTLMEAQELCNDTLSRQAVLDTLDTADKFMDEDKTIENYKALLKECYKVLPPYQKGSKERDYDVERRNHSEMILNAQNGRK